jgi:pimeloyl-ACP methyl ester carboxylesterase
VCIHGGGCNSNYFDLKGCSMVEEAGRRGMAVLLVNRPGYAGNRILRAEHPIAAAAVVVREFIDSARQRVGTAHGLVIVGHSIGGAIAVHLASGCGAWPLRAIAISGIGDAPAEGVLDIPLPDGSERIAPPEALTEALFDAGGHPLSWRAVASLRKAAEPWLRSEVDAVMHRWPLDWPGLAGGIEVPVHLRLAEHERIWQSGPAVLHRMARKVTRAPVDAALLPRGGHLYEVSQEGARHVGRQLDFLERCAASR